MPVGVPIINSVRFILTLSPFVGPCPAYEGHFIALWRSTACEGNCNLPANRSHGDSACLRMADPVCELAPDAMAT